MLNFTKWMLSAPLSLLISCTPKPPDVPVCEPLVSHMTTNAEGHVVLAPSPACVAAIHEAECGHCVYIISGKEIFVGEHPDHWLSGKSWTEIQDESVLVPATESYGPIITYIINSCKKMGCGEHASGIFAKFKLGK